MNNKQTVTFATSSLVSRASAAKQRTQIQPVFNTSGGFVQFDFSAVDSISSSYADELFGVLAQIYGLDNLVQKIAITNATHDVLYSIAEAIHYRAATSHKIAS